MGSVNFGKQQPQASVAAHKVIQFMIQYLISFREFLMNDEFLNLSRKAKFVFKSKLI